MATGKSFCASGGKKTSTAFFWYGWFPCGAVPTSMMCNWNVENEAQIKTRLSIRALFAQTSCFSQIRRPQTQSTRGSGKTFRPFYQRLLLEVSNDSHAENSNKTSASEFAKLRPPWCEDFRIDPSTRWMWARGQGEAATEDKLETWTLQVNHAKLVTISIFVNWSHT